MRRVEMTGTGEAVAKKKKTPVEAAQQKRSANAISIIICYGNY
jgi:hypothetical protein